MPAFKPITYWLAPAFMGFLLLMPSAHAATISETKQVKTMDSKRKIPLQGAYNCRDFGTLVNSEGKVFKSGLVMRCDNLGGLTSQDIDYFSKKDLATVIDLRTEQEIKATPDKQIPTVINDPHISIASGDLTAYFTDHGDLSNAMNELYRTMVLDEASQQKIKEVFIRLQNPNMSPLVFHCTAGKDRTGVIAMLLLQSLKFDSKTIMNDYMASLPNVEVMYAREIEARPEMASLLLVKPEYLNTAIDSINKQYGSLDAYLDDVIKVDRDKLRQLYLN